MSNCNIGIQRIIWRKGDITPTDVMGIVNKYFASSQYQYYEMLASYYDSENDYLEDTVERKREKGKTPNWFVPSAYYKTIVDNEAGYMFNDIVYKAKDEKYPLFSELLLSEFNKLNIDVIDMQTGTTALAFNRAYEVIGSYSEVKGGTPKLFVMPQDPRQFVAVYDVYGNIIMGITISDAEDKSKNKYNVETITKSEWNFYIITQTNEIIVNPDYEAKTGMLWAKCPVVEYNTELLNNNSSFHQVLPYIRALDALITGNTNELDKLAEAILRTSMKLSEEAKKQLGELKAVDQMDQKDFLEYVTRDISPAFREYLSRLLIQEIHKHAHIIDFYSPDTGIAGEASGRALRIRLVDMQMKSNVIEKTFKIGHQNRLAIIRDYLQVRDKVTFADDDLVDIIYNRTQVMSTEDIAPLLSTVDFLSKRTKQELSLVDPDIEAERLEEEEPKTMPINDIFKAGAKTEPEDDEDDDVEMPDKDMMEE